LFERFNDGARRVVVLAMEEARLLDHNYVGTEHLLLGVIREAEMIGEGVTAAVLDSPNISLVSARAEAEETVGRGSSTPSGHIPFTPRAKRALEQSMGEALHLGHDYIGTEHIFLGLLRLSDGKAAQVLRNLGVDPTDAHER
jgi:ATP-dependent Clp protease ATP-binding subunit ClpC